MNEKRSEEDWLIELEKRKIQLDYVITEQKKNNFIKEITQNLGEEIIKEPNKKPKKLSFWDKLKNMF